MFAVVLILDPSSTKELILTYSIRAGQSCSPGMLFAVAVNGRPREALVLRLQEEHSVRYRLLPLGKALSGEALVSRRGLALMRWLARYYVCPLNRAAALFLPPVLRPVRETRYFIPGRAAGAGSGGVPAVPDSPVSGDSPADPSRPVFSDRPAAPDSSPAAETANRQKMPAGLLFVEPAWQSLWEGIAKAGERGISAERIRARWGAPAREQAERWAKDGYLIRADRPRPARGARPSASRPGRPAAAGLEAEGTDFELTPAQQQAYDHILKDLQGSGCGKHLLFGVTGSGKTEVYLRLAAAAAAAGRQTVYLVPEISLVPQMIAKARQGFEGRLAILHSNLSAGERYAEWQRIRAGEAVLIIGPRSALFAPVVNLGLIIIDEEHEHTFKQHEPEPRYDARRAAEALARLWRATVVRGSATPDMESLYRCEKGAISLSRLPGRVRERPLPPIRWINMRTELREGHPHPVSRPLLAALRERKARGEQAILLMNRRGFHNYVLCRDCGHSLECPRCSIPLTYHRPEQAGRASSRPDRRAVQPEPKTSRLICHYCGYESHLRPACPHCGSSLLQYMGTGTQRVVDYLARELPELSLLRLDMDSTARAGSHGEILSAFQSGKADVLVGTQMVAKGFDFPRVTLSAVLHIDGILNLPDYQSSERAFQLILQTAGRAGRGDSPGQVMVQTFYPENPLLRLAGRYDYLAFYRHELALRQALGYPPLKKCARILVSARTDAEAETRLEVLTEECRQGLPPAEKEAIIWLGPAKAPLEKISNRWRRHLILLADAWAPLAHCLVLARKRSAAWGDEPRLILDMDAKSLL